MTPAGSPLDVLREVYDAVTPNPALKFEERVELRREFDAALAAVEQLVEAARNLDCCANKPDGEVAAMWAAFDAAVARFDRKPAQETKR